MSNWTRAWIAWGLAFFAIELPSLKHAGSLSEHARTVAGFDDSGPYPRARQAVFTAGYAFLYWHLWSKKYGIAIKP